MTYKDQLAAKANVWQTHGRTKEYLLMGGPFIRARLWSFTSGAKCEGDISLIREFVEKSFAEVGDKYWDNLFTGKDYCRDCGQSFNDENLCLCTNCSISICPFCVRNLKRHPNGNPSCRCGGEIIG